MGNNTNTYIELKMEDIIADDSFNCRGAINPIDVMTLAKDIEINGLLNPVVVSPTEGGKYKLRAGFCRFKAHQILKREMIMASIHDDLQSEDAALLLNFSENLHRKDLSLFQESRAIKRLMERGMTEAEIMRKLSVPRGWIQPRTMLLKLPEQIQELSKSNLLGYQNVRDLYTILQDEGQDACFEAAKMVKTAKQKKDRTFKLIRDRPRKELSKAKPRTLPEMRSMMNHIYDKLGANVATRFAAWALGDIEDRELYHSVKMYADTLGKTFIIPLEEFIPSAGEQLKSLSDNA